MRLSFVRHVVSWLGASALVAALVVAGAPASAADQGEIDRLEAAVTAAKEALRASPGVEAEQRLEAAVSALEAALDTPSTEAVRGQSTETEPNDTFGTASAVPSGDYGTGDLSPAGDVDFWSVSGAAVGDLVFVQTDTGESTTGNDTTLNVLAADGSTVIEFDDDDGGPLESAVAGAIVPQAGPVYFEVREFGNNGEITPYHLTAIVVDPASGAVEVEPNDTAGTANPVTAPLVQASLAAAGADTDFFSFSATAGDRVCVIMDDDPGDDSNLTHTNIDILDTDGSTVLLAGDDASTANANAAGTVVVGATGTYYLRVQDGGSGSDVDYSFVVVVNGAVVPAELQSLSVD